jgi:uncharacterized repeat protein (TIGR03803 family)
MNSKSNSQSWRYAQLNKVLVVQAAVALLGLAAADSLAQTYSVLHTFSGLDGAYPDGNLLLSGTTLIGATAEGGVVPYRDMGTVFKLNTDGSGFSILKSFPRAPDGEGPSGTLSLSAATVYGTTYMGGLYNNGTVFKLDTNGGNYQILKNFSNGNEGPGVRLLGDTLYGTTELVCMSFRINTNGGNYTVLRNYPSGSWARPELLIGSELYGTGGGDILGAGGIFKMDTNGNNFTVIRTFAGTDGEEPQGGVVLSGGQLYGTMSCGGSNGCGTVFKINLDGSGLVILKHFAGYDGNYPNADLVLSGTRLFGTTDEGGDFDLGTIFTLKTDGTDFKVLKSFTGADGAYPVGGLALAGSTLYGMTHAGGSSNCGVVFALGYSPTIQAPPQTQTAEAGGVVNFTVRASSDLPFTYQWFFNGNTITGCTTNRMLCLSGVQATNVGTYTVVVSNCFGAKTSEPVILNIIPPVERRPVPALNIMAEAGNALNVEYADALGSPSNWLPLDTVDLSAAPQLYLDVSAPLPPQRFYRVWQTGTPTAPPSLNLPFLVPAITLTGNIGGQLRLDCINQFGPTSAWVNLDTVTLTNTSQIYFDLSAPYQPTRLYRIVPVP